MKRRRPRIHQSKRTKRAARRQFEREQRYGWSIMRMLRRAHARWAWSLDEPKAHTYPLFPYAIQTEPSDRHWLAPR